MGIIINDNHKIEANKPAEYRYLNISQSWASVLEVNNNIPVEYRYPGLTVNIAGVEYWYYNGVSNINLIVKSSGGVSNVNNGLTYNSGINTISLGGTLTGNTIFNGGVSGYTLQYADKYHNTYTNRSLVDKEYVDTTAIGIRPLNAVNVATTGNTTLNGLQTIDGISVTAGMRVLVKNQVNPVENGIYNVSAVNWTRSTDFDQTTEVLNGSYVFVLSGTTNKNYSYVMTSPNPVDVDVDDIIWVIFGYQIGITPGTGINITQVGGNNVISFDGSSIAGTGLTWSGNKINLNGNATNVALYGITGVTNGLRKYNDHSISLGGDLTGSTYINTKYDAVNVFQIGNGTYSSSWYGGMLRISRDCANQCNNYGLIGGRIDSCNYSTITASPLCGTMMNTVINSVQRDVTLNSCGLVYGSCYHSSYSNRSLVDKEFVTNFGLSGVTNGLSVTNKKVKLGGTLTGNTNICTGNYSFKITPDTNNYGLFDLSLNNKYNSSSFNVCSTDSGSISNKWQITSNNNCVLVSHFLNSNNGNFITVRNYDILLYNKTSGFETQVKLNDNGLNYCQDYSACYTNRSLVDKEYVDNRVLCYANIVNVAFATSDGYVTQKCDNYIGVSGSSLIYLDPTPVLGQRVMIVDACGNALNLGVDGIVVDGNGNCINNSSTSSINTNYGAITYVYNGLFWSPTSFVN